MSDKPLTPRPRRPKMARPAEEPRIVVVEQPAANAPERWAAALDLLLDAGRSAEEDAR